MKKVKHWLHALLSVVTCGLWLPVYVIVIATTEMFNRGYRVGKAAGRVEKSNEYEELRVDVSKIQFNGSKPNTFVDDAGRRVIVGADGEMRFGCTMVPIVTFADTADSERVAEVLRHNKDVTTFERFKELGDRMLSGDPLDSYEQLEYQELRKEVVR